MPWLIIAGLLTLAAAWLLTILHRRIHAPSGGDHNACFRYDRIRIPRRIPRLLRKAALAAGESGDRIMLYRTLMMHTLLFRRSLPAVPALPGHAEREPRLMNLARQLLEQEISTASLQAALHGCPLGAVSSTEVLYLPQCIAAAQTSRVAQVLRSILRDSQERRSAVRLCRRLTRSKRPHALLARTHLHSAGLSALLSLLRAGENPPLLSMLEHWLQGHGSSADDITRQAMDRQLRQAEALRSADACFQALAQLDWYTDCEACDPLHPLLLEDPAGIYPRMTPRARAELRCWADILARRMRLQASVLAGEALRLSRAAAAHSPEDYVGYWLTEADGLRQLRRSLHARSGRLYTWFALHPEQRNRISLWMMSVFTGFLFLQSGRPVFALPFFALTVGHAIRRILPRFRRRPLQEMAIRAIPPEMRTLVVLPAVLPDEHAAIRMVRQLKIARHAFPDEHVDFLLLGDFAPCPTAVSTADGAVVQAAAAAIAALADKRCLYFQRSRSWDDHLHAYCGKGGRRGAVIGLCRLIAQGEYEDGVVFSSVEPAFFERRYAYVLELPPDCQAAPGMLETLLSAMTHPLHSRRSTPDGWRGFSVFTPACRADRNLAALIRPDVYLEATDGMADARLDPDAVCNALAGRMEVPDAAMTQPVPPRTWATLYADACQAWRTARWQLPWVQTPAGLVRNPLTPMARFHLRELLRPALIPLAQCSLLLLAMLGSDWGLLLVALLPELLPFPNSIRELLQAVVKLCLLPGRAVIGAAGILRALWPRFTPAAFVTLETFAQCIAAALLLGTGLALPGMRLPGFCLGLLFACFPLAHRVNTEFRAPEKGLTDEHIALLKEAALRTWHYFAGNMSEDAQLPPPDAVQFDPMIVPEDTTSPEAIAALLLSCVCAKDLGFVTAVDAARLIRATLRSYQALPQPLRLPCRRYARSTGAVLDAEVDAAAVGLLVAALMTAAQALRTWLPELPPEYAALSAELAHAAGEIPLSDLYDAATGLFFRILDADGQGAGHIACLADRGLLLSLAAIARRDVPPSHAAHLERCCIRHKRQTLPLSEDGTAAAVLLSGLFIPSDAPETDAFIRAMQNHGQGGLWGQSDCAYFRFDPALRYCHAAFGVREAALRPTRTQPVYAPYGAALCLPRTPFDACEALRRFRDAGAFSAHGFCDAVDCTQGQTVIGLHDTLHQGILLMAAAHLLADAPVQRYFCAVPEVEAALPLLHMRKPPLVLPALPGRTADEISTSMTAREANRALLPEESHLLGNRDFGMLIRAHGSHQLFDQGLPLFRRKDALQGIQFYIADQDQVFHLADPMNAGQTIFAPGEVKITQLCGSIRAELVYLLDFPRRRVLHLLTLTNLSTRDRVIDAADCLLPDLNAPPGTMEIRRPEHNRLRIHARGTERCLHHTINTSAPPLSLSACTDLTDFLGRGRTLHRPASLEEAPLDAVRPTSDSCLAFRARFALGGRSQATLWFTTSLLETEPPQLHELDGLRTLAAMQQQALCESIPITAAQYQAAGKLLALLPGCKQHIAMHAADWQHPDASADLAAALELLLRQGVTANLTLCCPPEYEEEALQPFTGCLCHPLVNIRSDLSPADSLLLQADQPLLPQLESLYQQQPASLPISRPPVPGDAPLPELTQTCAYGGFDPLAKAYVIHLAPGMTTPASWGNLHISRHHREAVDESGFLAPFHEQVWVLEEDGTALSPFTAELSRQIRIQPGVTRWEARADKLDMRLSAACMPNHRCAIRLLRLRNHTDSALTLQLAVFAHLGSKLHCAPGMALASPDEQGRSACAAGHGWDVRRIVPLPSPDMRACLALPDDAAGTTALLTCSVTIPPHASREVTWISGYVLHGEDAIRALRQLDGVGASTLLHQVKADWGRRLSAISCATPETSFDLLMNSILPVQSCSAEDISTIPSRIYLAPQEAKLGLLQAARRADSIAAWRRITLMLCRYVRITGDERVLEVSLPARKNTLHACCRMALLELPLNDRGLPDEASPARCCMLHALAAAQLAALRPDPQLADMSRKLLNAADIYLWQDGIYGDALQLDVQALACAAYGANPRTRQALRSAWAALYDPHHGLIRSQEATDIPPLPGLPENGGMRTLDAVLALHALLLTAQYDEAHALLRALNPLHHTDDSHRMEVFRCAPYRLHGGMYAAPMEAGRATADGGAEAAALLYAVILEDVLGLRRAGRHIRFHPHVPPEWETFTLTLQEGASTWHISLERRISDTTIDGQHIREEGFTIRDDGGIHHVHIPLK